MLFCGFLGGAYGVSGNFGYQGDEDKSEDRCWGPAYFFFGRNSSGKLPFAHDYFVEGEAPGADEKGSGGRDRGYMVVSLRLADMQAVGYAIQGIWKVRFMLREF